MTQNTDRTPLGGPAAWTGADLERDQNWIRHLEAPDIAAVVRPGQFVNVLINESPMPLLRRPMATTMSISCLKSTVGRCGAGDTVFGNSSQNRAQASASRIVTRAGSGGPPIGPVSSVIERNSTGTAPGGNSGPATWASQAVTAAIMSVPTAVLRMVIRSRQERGVSQMPET